MLFTAGEVDALNALAARTGSTLDDQLRKMSMGDPLGFGYADPAKRVVLPSLSYRAGLLVGVQPERAAAILGRQQGDGGMPQRFCWMPTRITRPAVVPARPPTWLLPEAYWTKAGDREMPVPVEATDDILADWYRLDRDPLDTHAMLTRLKVAAAFAVLDGVKYVRLRTGRWRPSSWRCPTRSGRRPWRCWGMSRRGRTGSAARRKAAPGGRRQRCPR